ncbi:MAG TPA: ATP-grasp domain-containing protein [Phycisphaerales bacterium]|nr:ATP-grasp domain-containing protein [Phycisphaerales bacterium]
MARKNMYNDQYPPAFVTYGWCRNAYGVIRSLGQMGVEVHVGDNSSLAMSRVSRYCKSFTKLPNFFTHPEQYFEATCQALIKTGAKVLLPCHEDVGLFCKWRERLPESVMIALPEQRTYDLVEDKLDCIELAQKHGCPVPEIFRISEISDLERFRQKNEWPLVIKTRIGNGSKGTRIVNNYEELERNFKNLINEFELPPERWPIIQEYLPGSIAWVSLLYENGQCVANSSCKPIRHKETDIHGNATLRDTGDYEELISKAVSLMNAIKWHGIAQLEFIPDKNGQFKLTEINARPWGSIALPVVSGVNIPYLWYLIAIDKLGPRMTTPNKKAKCRWILGDGIALFELLKKGQLRKALKIFQLHRNCYYDDFSLSDPLPLILESLDYFIRFVKWRGSSNPVTENMIR